MLGRNNVKPVLGMSFNSLFRDYVCRYIYTLCSITSSLHIRFYCKSKPLRDRFTLFGKLGNVFFSSFSSTLFYFKNSISYALYCCLSKESDQQKPIQRKYFTRKRKSQQNLSLFYSKSNENREKSTKQPSSVTF